MIKSNRSFITAQFWRLVDTASYLRDGRATIITAVIQWQGGEVEDQGKTFLNKKTMKKGITGLHSKLACA